jgi:hypothetical protein
MIELIVVQVEHGYIEQDATVRLQNVSSRLLGVPSFSIYPKFGEMLPSKKLLWRSRSSVKFCICKTTAERRCQPSTLNYGSDNNITADVRSLFRFPTSCGMLPLRRQSLMYRLTRFESWLRPLGTIEVKRLGPKYRLKRFRIWRRLCGIGPVIEL